jgi:hypothetical protein
MERYTQTDQRMRAPRAPDNNPHLSNTATAAGSRLALVYGPRGIGKTHLTLEIAYAASAGPFLRWWAPTARRVLILDGEMPAVVLQEQLASIADAGEHKLPASDFLRVLAIDLQERTLDLGNYSDQEVLEQEIGDAELVLVDNISRKRVSSGSWQPTAIHETVTTKHCPTTGAWDSGTVHLRNRREPQRAASPALKPW